MTHCSSKGKNIVTDDQSTPIAKRTRLSSQSSRDSTTEKFRTPLDSKTYTDIFGKAPPIVERIVKFDTLGTTFIPEIFEERNWVDLFGNFEDLIEELVKEFYSNARYTGVELKCWVRGMEFSINTNYIAKVLHIIRPANVDTTPYDDRVLKAQYILQVLGTDHEVVNKGTSIGTGLFLAELTTLKLIMFSNLYPFSNTAFINLGRAQFLYDLIIGVLIDIYAHIFQIIGKTAARLVARTNLPFCSLIMKIILGEGVSPPLDGKIVPCPQLISMFTLQASKSYSSRTPKSEPSTYETPIVHAPVTPVQSTSTSFVPPGFQTAKQSHLIANVFHRISDLERLLHSFHNQTQMHLTTIETQLNAI